MRKKTHAPQKTPAYRALAELCTAMDAELTYCNLHGFDVSIDGLAADLFWMIENAKSEGVKTGAVLCPGCGDIVLRFDLMQPTKKTSH